MTCGFDREPDFAARRGPGARPNTVTAVAYNDHVLRRSPQRLGAVFLSISLLTLTACGVEQGVVAQRSEPIGPVPTEIVDPLDDLGSTDTTVVDPDSGAEPADTVPSDSAPDVTPPTTEPIDRLPGSKIGIGDVVDIGDAKDARPYDDFVAAALTDIQEWWAREYPIVYGEEYQPLEGGIWAAYAGRSDELPGCGESTTEYRDVNEFAAFYCGLGDFMIYDDGDTSLLGQLSDEFGEVVMGVVLAHEFGHAIQFRSGAFDTRIETIFTEQQADCFSGAWVGQAYRGESPNIRLNDADVRGGLIAMISVRDPVGTSQFDVEGHGSAFDRVGAFQVGFREGPARCALLLDDPLPLVPNEFQPNSTDQFRGGNAPYDCTNQSSTACQPAYEFLAEDLNAFWADRLATTGFDPLVVDPVDGLDSDRLATQRSRSRSASSHVRAPTPSTTTNPRCAPSTPSSAISRSATRSVSRGPKSPRFASRARSSVRSGHWPTTVSPEPG